MRIKWLLLFFVLCVMFTIAGCGTVSDREVKMRYGVSFVSVESHISFLTLNIDIGLSLIHISEPTRH